MQEMAAAVFSDMTYCGMNVRREVFSGVTETRRQQEEIDEGTPCLFLFRVLIVY